MEHLPTGLGGLMLQFIVILTVARMVGWLAIQIGQPRVVGEMIAGILLGPTLFGYFSPQLQQQLFSPEGRPFLQVGAQIGIGLYMFLVGLEFNTSMFKTKLRSATAVSLSGIAAPFIVAILLAEWIFNIGGLFSPQVTLTQATLFLGAAISITAFPMLARVLQEQGLANSKLGTLVLAAGAIDDVAAWSLLALLLASFGGDDMLFFKAIFGAILFAWFMLRVFKKRSKFLERWFLQDQRLTPRILLLVLIFWVLSVMFTEWIGLHAVFGGFLLGVAMPRGQLATRLIERMQPIVLFCLVPLFFTISGLKTDLSLLGEGILFQVSVIVVIASILAKAVACYIAARVSGENNQMSMSVGVLMNARGMMELILLNIALQNGIITSGLFSVLVLMTIVTTMMATPLFNALQRLKGFRDALN